MVLSELSAIVATTKLLRVSGIDLLMRLDCAGNGGHKHEVHPWAV